LGHPLSRPDRKYDHPIHPVEEVIALARQSAVALNDRSWVEAGKYFGDGVVAIKAEIIDVLLDLSIEEWQFRQLKNGEWADVYRVGLYEDFPDAWIKIKIERPKGKQTVMVISFHEWDDAKPT
jgi:hypothetical protein